MPLPWLFPVIFGAGGASLPDDITTIGWRLEFSPDDLSVPNADATRVDITSILKKGSLRWTAGGQTLGEGPKAGEMSFTLLGRDFEPHYAASPHFPNVLRKRRFFVSYGVGASFQDDFVGYARTFQPVWPGNVTHQEIDVVCGDGFDIIGDDRLPALDPPEATTHGEVLAFDEPSFQYALGERGGTKVVSHSRTRRQKKDESDRHWRRHHRVHRWRTRETRRHAEGISGPPGTYKNTPKLGEPGGALGDPGTSVLFRGEQMLRGTPAREYARIPLDGETELGDVAQLTIVALAKLERPPAGVSPVVSGPNVPSLSQSSFRLAWQGDRLQFTVRLTDETSKSVSALFFPPTGEWLYIAGRWNGETGTRSVLVYDTAGNVYSGDNDMAFGELRRGEAAGYVYLNRDAEGNYGDQWLQHVAIYEEELSLERIEAQVDSAFFRGYPQQTAGERIAAAAASDLWDESNIVTSPFSIVPAMKLGQSPLDVIEEAMGAEGVRSIFGFRPHGDPFYLPWEWLADDTTVQLLVGAPRDQGEGELFFADQDLRYDDTVWNEATVSRDGGEAQTASDAASIEDFGPNSAEPVTGLPNTNDADVALLAQEIVGLYAEPTWVLERVDLHGGDAAELEALLTIGIGDLVRYRRRSYDDTAASMGAPIDVLAHVLGYEKRWEGSGQVTGTLYLARGFDAADGVWRMGVDGFSELGETTTLA